MIELPKEELLEATGGTDISATLLSTLVRGAELSFELGQVFGTAIRRLLSGSCCKI